MDLNKKIEFPVKDIGVNNVGTMTLVDMVESACFCKLKECCPDKTVQDCLLNSNIYQEFMLSKKK